MTATTNTQPALTVVIEQALYYYGPASNFDADHLRAAIREYGAQRAREAAEQMREQCIAQARQADDGLDAEIRIRALPITGDSHGS